MEVFWRNVDLVIVDSCGISSARHWHNVFGVYRVTVFVLQSIILDKPETVRKACYTKLGHSLE